MAILTATDVSTGDVVQASQHNAQNYDLAAINQDVLDFVGQGLGSGKDGTFTLGSIAGTPSAPTIASVATSGDLTGTFTYKISAYNESGHTIASAASASTGAITSKQVVLTLPAMPSSGKGWKIYRSTDGVTWYLVGRSVGTGTSYTDNTPAKGSETAPASNTTGTSWSSPTGEWHFDGDMALSSAVTVGSTGAMAGVLIIRCRGRVTCSAAVSANGTYPDNEGPIFGTHVVSQTVTGGADGNVGGTTPTGGTGFGAALKGIGWQTAGGVGVASNNASTSTAGTAGNAGGIIVIVAEQIDLTGTGSVTANGATGGNGSGTGTYIASGGGGGPGGAVFIIARDWLRVQSGASVTANGGNGGNGAGAGGTSQAGGGGGGGGGYIVLISPIIENAGTVTAATGTGGTKNATGYNNGHHHGGGGGAHSGAGGAGGNTANGSNGVAGAVVTGSSATGLYWQDVIKF